MVENKSPIVVNLDSFKKIEESILGKKKKVKTDDSVVKINSGLLSKVEEFINLEENKFKYTNRKQFIDIAVSDYLKKVKK